MFSNKDKFLHRTQGNEYLNSIYIEYLFYKWNTVMHYKEYNYTENIVSLLEKLTF